MLAGPTEQPGNVRLRAYIASVVIPGSPAGFLGLPGVRQEEVASGEAFVRGLVSLQVADRLIELVGDWLADDAFGSREILGHLEGDRAEEPAEVDSD
jgi:hypothetical protein